MTFVFIALLLLSMELAYFRIADRFGIVDKPNMRGSSTRVALRGGGVIFPAGILLYCLFFGWQGCGMGEDCMPCAFVLGLLLISLVSFVDDIHSVSNRIRFAVHVVAMLLMFWQWDILNLESWWMILVALVFCTGVINAFNFMDGINGITAGYGLAVLAPLALLNSVEGIADGVTAGFVSQNLVWTFGIGLLVFSWFNFRKKARCFAGDVGSVAVAFILLFVTGRLVLQTGDLWWLMVMAVYGIDTGCTIVHRIMLHENLGEAHRKHAFQLMANELRIPHVVVSLIYMVVQLVVSAGLIWLPVNKWMYSACVIVVLCLAYVLFMKKYYHLHEVYLATTRQKENV